MKTSTDPNFVIPYDVSELPIGQNRSQVPSSSSAPTANPDQSESTNVLSPSSDHGIEGIGPTPATAKLYPSVDYPPPASSVCDISEEQDIGDTPTFDHPFSKPRPRVPCRDDDERHSQSPAGYGPNIPMRVPRRYRKTKTVQLFHGNLVIDCPVPKKLLENCGDLSTHREFSHLRYSAATCDPNDFHEESFTLRQCHYDPPRRTELFILMTMSDEDEEPFTQSMQGVMTNIAHLCTRARSKTWGRDAWKKVVVCIVSDGRAKVNSRVLSVLTAMGCYQEGVAQAKIGTKSVRAHIYEYTSRISVTPSLEVETSHKEVVPLQVIFCLKERSENKINSHRWFFNAFGPILFPNVCVLLEVGTVPGPTSIYHLWKVFDIDSNVGGACGEIIVQKGKYGGNLLNPLVAAQHFEYKMSNILGKSLESVFGYITVMPSSFSAYRYIALQDVNFRVAGPLYEYFLGEKTRGSGGVITANMFLAEDHILSWEIVSKRRCSWTLHYAKSAYATQDVPYNIPELISQRRWLNGFFASVHSTFHFYYIYRSSHSLLRKFWIHVKILYQFCNLFVSWFTLGNYYISFSILITSMEAVTPKLHIANMLFTWSYLGLLLMCFILVLGNRPQASEWGFTLAVIGFAIITVYSTVAGLLLTIRGINQLVKEHNGALGFKDFLTNPIFRNYVLSLITTYGLYLLPSFIFFEPWHMITSSVQYLLLVPSYINVLHVYAFANIYDISWRAEDDGARSLGVASLGRSGKIDVALPDENEFYDDALQVLHTKVPKPQVVNAGQREADYYRNFRTIVLLAWVLTNSLLAALMTGTFTRATPSANAVPSYMSFLLYSMVLLAFVKFCGSFAYMISRFFGGE